jgi:murein L,D-transpeptidase YafK
LIPVLRKFCSLLVLLWVAFGLVACGGFVKGDNRHNQPLSGVTQAALKAMGSSPGEGMVVRIFKEESVLEVWKRTNTGQYRLFKSYDICAYSGNLGPKIKEGDRQSPEGFYTITPGLMNPKSSYYLAFNTGFPNKFDRSHGRTGTDLMVHGDCSSRGCYAMTDEGIAEIYALARESFKGGNPSFQLQIYPFRMNAANLAKHASSEHLGFWKNIKEGSDLFDLNKAPPVWDVCERRYIFNAGANAPLDPVGVCPVVNRDPALVAKLAAEEAAFSTQVESLADKQAREAAQAERQAAVDAAAKARGEAINGAVSGLFGNIFGGKQEEVVPVITGKPAPQPMPPLNRP